MSGGGHLLAVPGPALSVPLSGHARTSASRPVPADHPPRPAPRGRSGFGRATTAATRGAPTGAVIELDRVVNASGHIGLGNRYVSVGLALAGQRITLRLDGVVAHVIADGVLARTIPAPVPPELRGRLRGARLATRPFT